MIQVLAFQRQECVAGIACPKDVWEWIDVGTPNHSTASRIIDGGYLQVYEPPDADPDTATIFTFAPGRWARVRHR